MRIAIINPPFILPVLPPLGIGCLKAYIEKNMPDIEVKCLDFNLDWHRHFFESLEKKEDKNEVEKEILELKKFCSPDKVLNHKEYDKKGRAFRNLFKTMYKQADEGYAGMLLGKGRPDDILRGFAGDLLEYKPDVIAFSVCHNKQWHFASCLARGMRGQLKGVKIVFGGSFFSVDAEKKFSGLTMDYIIYGEGEIGFLQLLKNLKNPAGVPSLVYEHDGKVKQNLPAVINNLELLPFPDLSDFNLKEYFNPEPVAPILTSRGCYWQKCAFCVHHKAYSLFRTRKISVVVDEIRKYTKQGVSYFHFVDEMIAPKRFEQISRTLLQEKLDIKYLALAKPVKEFTPELAGLMYSSGCRMIVWGVESGSQKVLDKINKGTSTKEISSALENSALAGIKNHVFVMLGFPSETEQDFEQTLDFLFENKEWIHSIHRGLFTLNAGSRVFMFPESFGIEKIHDKSLIRTEYEYEIKKGITKNRAVQLLFACNNFFDSFNPYSDVLNTFREHALYVYSNKKIDYSRRTILAKEDMRNSVSYKV